MEKNADVTSIRNSSKIDISEQFVRVGQYFLNMSGIDYVEESDESRTVIHFAGGKHVQLGEVAAEAFWKRMAAAPGDAVLYLWSLSELTASFRIHPYPRW